MAIIVYKCIASKVYIHTLLKIKSYIYGDLLAAAGCQLVPVNLRPMEYTVFHRKLTKK